MGGISVFLQLFYVKRLTVIKETVRRNELPVHVSLKKAHTQSLFGEKFMDVVQRYKKKEIPKPVTSNDRKRYLRRTASGLRSVGSGSDRQPDTRRVFVSDLLSRRD